MVQTISWNRWDRSEYRQKSRTELTVCVESSCVSRRWRPAACYCCCLKPVVVSSGCLNRRFSRLWSSSRLWFTQSVKLETYRSWHGAGIYNLDTMLLILTCETIFHTTRKIWHNCDDMFSVSSCPVAQNSRQTLGNIKGAVCKNSNTRQLHTAANCSCC